MTKIGVQLAGVVSLCVGLFVTLITSVPQALPGNSTVVSFSAPASVTTGQEFTADVSLRNTGTTTWSPSNQYLLGSWFPQDNGVWGKNRWALPSTVAPGATVNIKPVLRATTAGTHRLGFKMLREGDNWFGAEAGGTSVVVTASPGPPPPPPGQSTMPTPWPYPDSVVCWNVINTGIMPVDVVRNFAWTNNTGSKLLVRHAELWVGCGVGQINDANGELKIFQNGGPNSSILVHLQWDRYAPPSGPFVIDKYFTPDMKVIIMPGDLLNLGCFANTVGGTVRAGTHFVARISVQVVP